MVGEGKWAISVYNRGKNLKVWESFEILQFKCSIMTNSEVGVMKAALEALRATWNLDTNSEFTLGQRKTIENLIKLLRFLTITLIAN
jgi:hypothetical protein